MTWRAVDRRDRQLMSERANVAASSLDRRLDTYTEKLYGVRATYAAHTGRPSHREFNDFLLAQELERRFPGIKIVGIIQPVKAAQRAAFERRLARGTRESGLPYPSLRVEPPGRRDEYGLVTYVYPVGANAISFAIDAYMRFGRREAMARARDTAQPVAAPPVRLPLDAGRRVKSLLVMLPIYSGSDQTPPAEERRRRFEGVAYSGIRLPELMRDIADIGAGEDAELRDNNRLVYDARPDVEAADARQSRDLPLTIAGRSWALTFSREDSLVTGGERAVPWLIGALGILVSLLAGATLQAASSARRRAVALAAEMTADLERSNQELERFAFLASHDLQQPLRTVSGFLQLLDRQAGDRLDPRAREYIDQALKGIRQMAGLIDDLLTYSRVARDDRPLHPVDLDEAWDAAVDQLKAAIEQTGAEVSREDLPVVPGDPGQLVQVFANLIGNAIKYRGEAVPQVQARAERINGVWEVSVQDNGIGIDPQDHGRIFEMFRRLHSDEEVEGTGVGLALVKRIVERSGGQITVVSRPGDGSRFVLRMPPAKSRERVR